MSNASDPDAAAEGYRLTPRGGPCLRADVVEVHVFRSLDSRAAAEPAAFELLQLRRSTPPLKDTWQPLMGHIEAGESALACALREMTEELRLASADASFLGAWALEQVHPYYMPEIDCIVLSPRFAVEAAQGWSPTLNDEHGAYRWVSAAAVDRCFYWPGQRAACKELLRDIAPRDSSARERRRLAVT